MAAISPTVLGSGVYTVSASRRLVAELSLDIVSAAPFTTVQVRFPTVATGVGVVLGRAGATLDLPVTVGTITTTTAFTNRRVTVRTSVLGTQTVVECEIRATAMVTVGEVWSVRAQAATEQTWRFTQNDDTPADPTITRLMCDPVCGFTVSAPSLTGSVIVEKDVVTLAAADPLGTAAAPTVVGPTPTISYRFDRTGALAVPGLPGCSATPKLTLALPGVTADEPISFIHDVWFETDCTLVGFLTSAASPQPVTVRWNPPWTVAALTAGPLTLRPGEPFLLQFAAGGRPGTPAELRVETSPQVVGMFSPASPLAVTPTSVTPGPGSVDVTFTPDPGTASGTAGTFVGRLVAPGKNTTLAQSPPIAFEVRRMPPTGG